MNIYTARQIRSWDEYTIEHEPVSSINLMERAAHAITGELLQSKYFSRIFFIFCGPGNNGGDGLAVARMLHHLQWQVKVFILASEKFSAGCNTNFQRLKELSIPVKEIDGAEEFPIIPADAIVIDALFGTGLNKALGGLAAMLVLHLNQHNEELISIDVPSGLFADRSSVDNIIVKATTTLSFETPKLAFMMPENAGYVGEWKILDIGLHQRYSQQTEAGFEMLEAPYIQSLIKPRLKFSHKYSHGHALLYAGSRGMYGAGILCAKACLKSGVGLVSIVVEEKHLSIYQTTLPEAICITDWNNENIIIKKTAIGIGPGWATTDDYTRITKQVLSQSNIPMVVDASALQVLSNEDIKKQMADGTIITPHVGEFEKCFGKSTNDFERLELALQKAKELGIFIVLKGAYTIIATPQGKAYFNSTGNAGMAKGGSGDVLTGLLTGLLAQNYSPLHACLIGVYLHGLAGDLAAGAYTQYAMTAMDIIEKIGEAWKVLTTAIKES